MHSALVSVIAVATALTLAAANVACNAEEGDTAIITDRTGRKWNVSHARERYGMNPNFFNFGLGVGAIPSVDSPRVLAEGEPGYPTDEALEVFGLTYHGTHRAYAVSDLVRHEVFNDTFPGETLNYAAVAY